MIVVIHILTNDAIEDTMRILFNNIFLPAEILAAPPAYSRISSDLSANLRSVTIAVITKLNVINIIDTASRESKKLGFDLTQEIIN